MRNRLLIFILVLLLVTQQATAALLTLSTHSSDTAVSPDVLDATLDFSVVGTALSVIVSNNTAGLDVFEIDKVWFNAPSDITALDLVAASANYGQWQKGTVYGQDGQAADGFGVFDVVIADNKVANVGSGETVTFVFDITGPGTYTGADFASLLSQVPPGDESMYAAAHFQSGTSDQGAFGATDVPEPATIGLFGLGVLGLLRRRKSS